MNIYIEKLDSGYILHKEGKKIAVGDADFLLELLKMDFKSAINNIYKVRNMQICVQVEENLPTLKED